MFHKSARHLGGRFVWIECTVSKTQHRISHNSSAARLGAKTRSAENRKIRAAKIIFPPFPAKSARLSRALRARSPRRAARPVKVDELSTHTFRAHPGSPPDPRLRPRSARISRITSISGPLWDPLWTSFFAPYFQPKPPQLSTPSQLPPRYPATSLSKLFFLDTTPRAPPRTKAHHPINYANRTHRDLRVSPLFKAPHVHAGLCPSANVRECPLPSPFIKSAKTNPPANQPK